MKFYIVKKGSTNGGIMNALLNELSGAINELIDIEQQICEREKLLRDLRLQRKESKELLEKLINEGKLKC